MYTSRLHINASRRARRLLTSPQAICAAVFAGFADPDSHTRPDARTLRRLDEGLNHRLSLSLYIVSSRQPDLTDRRKRHGFDILNQTDGHFQPLIVHQRQTRTSTRHHGQPLVAFVTATYDGALGVDDPLQLRDTLVNGVGHSKAHGRGLFTLAPTVTTS